MCINAPRASFSACKVRSATAASMAGSFQRGAALDVHELFEHVLAQGPVRFLGGGDGRLGGQTHLEVWGVGVFVGGFYFDAHPAIWVNEEADVSSDGAGPVGAVPVLGALECECSAVFFGEGTSGFDQV